MAEKEEVSKTRIGRTRNVVCPYCQRKFYGIPNANVHIAYAHPGERTLSEREPVSLIATEENTHKKRKEVTMKPQKKKKKQPEYEEEEDDTDETEDEEEGEDEEDDDDPYS